MCNTGTRCTCMGIVGHGMKTRSCFYKKEVSKIGEINVAGSSVWTSKHQSLLGLNSEYLQSWGND